MNEEILHAQIEREFKSLFTAPIDVPDYIQNNLNHKLRPYQEEAISHFIFTQTRDTSNMSFKHLLFHMATGSGKTLVLASTILYLYKEKGHHNFIFFVNSDAIIKKTIDNLTNFKSAKYLFNPDGIEIDGKQILIRLVDTFPVSPDKDTIYLKMTTIQKLHMDLTNPAENQLTYESLQNDKVVLLADEAHHINVITRNDKKSKDKKVIEEKTWENTVNKILNQNQANRLIEFTATIDLTNQGLFGKYHSKIVYQYDLKRFMNDRYSKNVVLLRTNEEDITKIFHAILLSQYRKYIAKEHGIPLKPIILFKSNKIKISEQAEDTFYDLIDQMDVETLSTEVDKGFEMHVNSQGIWNKVFTYYKSLDLNRVLRDLKWDFSRMTTLNANKNTILSESNAVLLNSLEELDNPIRTIFAVAKLNEGWDVLNLFDIVRISEGAPTNKASTDSEAQLIGRGARYYPFKYENNFSSRRRFDYSNSDLRIIETLHYHTINESTYIKNLNKSLSAAEIQILEDQFIIYEAKIKSQFKKTDLYKKGKVYVNKLRKTDINDYQCLNDYNISNLYEISLFDRSIEAQLGRSDTHDHVASYQKEISITKEVWRKAIQRNRFFRFNNLKKFMPALQSINQLIESNKFFGGITFKCIVPDGIKFTEIDSKQKLYIAERFLKNCEKKIRSNYQTERGTPEFEEVAFLEVFKDYVIELNQITQSMNQIIRTRNMRTHDWYVYDKFIGNELEESLVNLIHDYMSKLQEKYEDVYLIRNERQYKVFEIGGSRGFMPDFLLYLKDINVTYQVFIEPKGAHLVEKDSWKQDLLLSLSKNEDVKVLTENENVRLIGLRFYTNADTEREEFKKDFESKLSIH